MAAFVKPSSSEPMELCEVRSGLVRGSYTLRLPCWLLEQPTMHTFRSLQAPKRAEFTWEDQQDGARLTRLQTSPWMRGCCDSSPCSQTANGCNRYKNILPPYAYLRQVHAAARLEFAAEVSALKLQGVTYYKRSHCSNGESGTSVAWRHNKALLSG